MGFCMIRALGLVAFGLLVAIPAPGVPSAAEMALELKWAQLVPPVDPAAKPKPNRTFFSGATPRPDDASEPPPPAMPEGKWMSRQRRQPGQGTPPAVVKELDGKRIRMGGYVVPLDFDATKVKEFLLVPFVGACIHVPPPPANQIVYVKTEKGFEVAGSFDPVYVTGTIKTAVTVTGLAETGYSIDAELVEVRKDN